MCPEDAPQVCPIPLVGLTGGMALNMHPSCLTLRCTPTRPRSKDLAKAVPGGRVEDHRAAPPRPNDEVLAGGSGGLEEELAAREVLAASAEPDDHRDVP